MNKRVDKNKLKRTMLIILFFIMAYLAMFFINTSYSGLILVPVYFIVAILLKPDNALKIFYVLMFFNYPFVNAVGISVIFLVYFLKSPRMIKIPLKSTLGFVILFFVITILTTITAIDIRLAGNELLTWFYILELIICCRYSGNAKMAFHAILFASIGLSMIYIGKYFEFSFYQILSNLNFIRVPDYNYSAIIIFCSIPILHYLRSKLNILSLVSELLLVIGLVSTNSRGIMLLLITYYIILILCNIKTISYKKLCLMIIAIVGFIIVAEKSNLYAYFISQISTVFDRTHFSNRVRIDMYKNIIVDMVPHYLLSGVGPNNFTDVYSNYSTISFQPNHAHNIYLQILVEEGAVALAVLLIYFFKWANSIIFYFNSKKFDKEYMKIMVTVFSTFTLYGLIEYVWGDSRCLSLFLVIMTLYELQIGKMKRNFDKSEIEVKDNAGSYVYNK